MEARFGERNPVRTRPRMVRLPKAEKVKEPKQRFKNDPKMVATTRVRPSPTR